MHVITKKRIAEAMKEYPDSAPALKAWHAVIEKNIFINFAELKRAFNSVDKVGAYCVFDIGGNKLRLIATIHFNRQKVYIHYILKHHDYEKVNWKN